MNQSFKNCYMIYWIALIAFPSIPLIVCSVSEIQMDSIPRHVVSLLPGCIFQAIAACLGGAFWYLMIDGDIWRYLRTFGDIWRHLETFDEPSQHIWKNRRHLATVS